MINEEVQLYVSNLPNTASDKQIIAYLSTAGPIKDYKINKIEERCSVHVIYYNIESAQLAKKYLGSRQFQGRDLKINYDTKKQNLTNVTANLNQLNEDDNIIKLLNQLKPEQKEQLFSYLSNLYLKEDQMIIDFFQTKPKILEALMKKGNQNPNMMGSRIPTYFQPIGRMGGMGM